MLENTIAFVSPVGRGRDRDAAEGEPSHIHIARPSRLLQRATPGSSAEAVDDVRDPAAAEVTLQAA